MKKLLHVLIFLLISGNVIAQSDARLIALNPQAGRHLVKAAQRFREDALLVDEMAHGAFLSFARIEPSGEVALDASALAEAPPALANRVAALALRSAGADPRKIATRHIDSLVDLARGGSGRELHLPGRIVARKARKWLRLRRCPPGDRHRHEGLVE